jgi:hypothetical protein
MKSLNFQLTYKLFGQNRSNSMFQFIYYCTGSKDIHISCYSSRALILVPLNDWSESSTHLKSVPTAPDVQAHASRKSQRYKINSVLRTNTIVLPLGKYQYTRHISICSVHFQQKIKMYFTAASRRRVTANYRLPAIQYVQQCGHCIQMALTWNCYFTRWLLSWKTSAVPEGPMKSLPRGSLVPVCDTGTEYRKHLKDINKWLRLHTYMDSVIPCTMNEFQYPLFFLGL